MQLEDMGLADTGLSNRNLTSFRRDYNKFPATPREVVIKVSDSKGSSGKKGKRRRRKSKRNIKKFDDNKN